MVDLRAVMLQQICEISHMEHYAQELEAEHFTGQVHTNDIIPDHIRHDAISVWCRIRLAALRPHQRDVVILRND